MNQQLQLSTITWLENQFSAFEQNLNGTRGSNLIDQSRKRAFATLTASGFPTPSQEDWKYTDVTPFLKQPYQIRSGKADVSRQQITALLPQQLDAHTFILVDGAFRADLSDPTHLPGIEVVSLYEVCLGSYQSPIRKWIEGFLSQKSLAPKRHFSALNAAFLRDGLLIYASTQADCDKPIHIINCVTPSEGARLNTPRVILCLENSAKIRVIESFVAIDSSRYLSIPLTEVQLAEKSNLEYVRYIAESAEAGHISTFLAEQQADSHLAIHTHTCGGKLVRNDIECILAGERCMTVLNGLSDISASQHVDNSTVLDHAAAHCESRELYKGIYADKSRGVFSGTIIVRPDAQKTNAIQSNRALLLSNDASIDSRPQLKIWADDVKCTHGATVGQLDEEALFYLRSRGVPKNIATTMMIKAFAGEVIETISDQALRTYISAARD